MNLAEAVVKLETCPITDYKEARLRVNDLERSLSVARDVVKRQQLNGEYAPWIVKRLKHVSTDEKAYCDNVLKAAGGIQW